MRKLTIPLDEDAELAAALGRLLGHWAVCENNLTGCLAVALGVELDKARFVWQQFQSARDKIELLQKVNHHFTEDADRRRELEALLTRASRLNGLRNGYVHALWARGYTGIVRIKTGRLAREERFADSQQIRPHDVEGVIERMAEVSDDLHRWSRVAW